MWLSTIHLLAERLVCSLRLFLWQREACLAFERKPLGSGTRMCRGST
jgi:hypothetical protein